jgi:hypothetical protein
VFRLTRDAGDFTTVAYWSVVEANVSIFCACMPALHQFWRQKLSPSVTSAASTAGSQSQGHVQIERQWASRSGKGGTLKTTKFSKSGTILESGSGPEEAEIQLR